MKVFVLVFAIATAPSNLEVSAKVFKKSEDCVKAKDSMIRHYGEKLKAAECGNLSVK